MRDYGILRCKGDGIDIFRTVFTDFGPEYNESLGICMYKPENFLKHNFFI